MIRFLVSVVLGFVPLFAVAHQPALVAPESPTDYIMIKEPTISFAYYGELTGWPHTYELRADEPMTLYVKVLEPAIKSARKNHSGIVVRNVKRGVEEVARLHYSDAAWESEYEPFGGDRYLQGAEYESEVPAGDYVIEVSNGDNDGKYVLVVGTEEDFSGVGYFQTLGRIYQVKRFFEKPFFAVLQSPFYYVPTLIMLIIVAGVWYWRRKRSSYA